MASPFWFFITADCLWDIVPETLMTLFLMGKHLTKDVPQQTLFESEDPGITNEKDTKPYILRHLDNIKLSRSQYISRYIINYGPYIDNMFSLENLAFSFHRKLIDLINSTPHETQ